MSIKILYKSKYWFYDGKLNEIELALYRANFPDYEINISDLNGNNKTISLKEL